MVGHRYTRRQVQARPGQVRPDKEDASKLEHVWEDRGTVPRSNRVRVGKAGWPNLSSIDSNMSNGHMLYGPHLSRVQLNSYSRHFKNSIGFGTRANTSQFMVAAPKPIPKFNTALNVPDNDDIDNQTKATDFTNKRETLLAPSVTEFLGAGSTTVEKDGGPLFQPVPANKAELAQAEARKRKNNQEIEDKGGYGDNIKITDTPASSGEARKCKATARQWQEPQPPSPKKARVRKQPNHRFAIDD